MSTSEHTFTEGDIVLAYGSDREDRTIWIGVVVSITSQGNPRVKYWNETTKNWIAQSLVMQPSGLTFLGRAPEDG